MDGDLYLGIDIGTSGVRAVAIDGSARVAGDAARPMPPPRRDGHSVLQDGAVWWDALTAVLDTLGARVALDRVRALAVDGTSGTLLLVDEDGWPIGPARLYNDAACVEEAARIRAVAPSDCAAHGPTSALAKLLRMQDAAGARHALHQADWIAGRLCGRIAVSDENNALKMGYDPVARRWPEWFADLGVRHALLPEVVEPGTPLGTVDAALARRFGLSASARVVAGSTDGCAAFIATGADTPGDGVTSLGSTLVIKTLSDRPLFAPEYGIYSHRLGARWLAGGASNTGGGVLGTFFDDDRMAELTDRVRPEWPTGLDYYPLAVPGERFPVNDPALAPRLDPRPEDDAVFFQGLLEGIAAIERQAYDRLTELGAPPVRSVRTVGKGAGNKAWTAIRANVLGVPMVEPPSQDAAYGTALLARGGLAADEGRR